jgi:secernin
VHSSLQLEYVSLPQTDVTFATLGASPYWCWGYEQGINEYHVAIGNEAIYTKTFRDAAQAYQTGRGPALGLLGMDLVRLALERSRSAAEAVEVIGSLVERYGQFGSGVPTKDHAAGGYDNAFLVADPHEAWVFEAFGQQWAARRHIQGCASISNQASIRTAWDAQSSQLVEYAERNTCGQRRRLPLMWRGRISTSASRARSRISASSARVSCSLRQQVRSRRSG